MTGYRIPTMRSRENHPAPIVIDRAPCCGVRSIPADMLRYIGDLSADIRTRAGIPLDWTYICDGCQATIFREGRVGHCEWHQAIGAPAAHIEIEKKFMESYPYPIGSRGHELKLQHHPHLKD